MVQRLLHENSQLKAQLASAEAENQELSELLDEMASRLLLLAKVDPGLVSLTKEQKARVSAALAAGKAGILATKKFKGTMSNPSPQHRVRLTRLSPSLRHGRTGSVASALGVPASGPVVE